MLVEDLMPLECEFADIIHQAYAEWCSHTANLSSVPVCNNKPSGVDTFCCRVKGHEGPHAIYTMLNNTFIGRIWLNYFYITTQIQARSMVWA